MLLNTLSGLSETHMGGPSEPCQNTRHSGKERVAPAEGSFSNPVTLEKGHSIKVGCDKPLFEWTFNAGAIQKIRIWRVCHGTRTLVGTREARFHCGLNPCLREEYSRREIIGPALGTRYR